MYFCSTASNASLWRIYSSINNLTPRKPSRAIYLQFHYIIIPACHSSWNVSPRVLFKVPLSNSKILTERLAQFRANLSVICTELHTVEMLNLLLRIRHSLLSGRNWIKLWLIDEVTQFAGIIIQYITFTAYNKKYITTLVTQLCMIAW